MRNCPSCKSSKLLLVRGKIKRVAYHPAWLAPMQQLCPTLTASSDLQALQELLPGALGWWVTMGLYSLEGKKQPQPVGALVLGRLHSWSVSCLPVLQQNLRLYQKSQEITFLTISSDPQFSSLKPSFPCPEALAILQTDVPRSATSSLAPITTIVAPQRGTSQHPSLAWPW